jgi:ribose-phosphate pyrophosphokinase
MMKTFIITTSAAEHLADNLERRFKNFEVILPDLSRDNARYFPDGEIYMGISKVNELKSKRVVVLHSGSPKPNEGLAELELILQILRDNNIKPEVFFSYFPYGMQDKVFKKGETNVAENLVEKLINYYKVKKIYIIDAHFGGRKWVKKYPIINISAVSILIERAKQTFDKNIIFLSPDKGGKRRTKISGFEKKRLNSFTVKMFSSAVNLKGKIAGVVDDVLKTGGTLLKFYEFAKKAGARQVVAIVTHGVLDSGIKKTRSKFQRLYLTNTINRKEANVDITELIAAALNHKK